MAATPSQQTGRTRLDRRAFLRTVAATAAGVAAIAAGGWPLPRVAHADDRDKGRDVAPPEQFGRMFPRLPPFATASSALSAALLDIGKPGGILDARDDLAKGPILLITDGVCDRVMIRRDHAILLPEGRSLPFPARGPVFRIR